eukprot:comp19310_c0_seq1/m.22178 comp19310_c0_seq1/g.22178  ORF comp19310_c0_seq1/g.22178 comp19310_c0_seq1/m.22178 type:complete len:461 (-) comp19310_c0_seq1:99-1481(-)
MAAIALGRRLLLSPTRNLVGAGAWSSFQHETWNRRRYSSATGETQRLNSEEDIMRLINQYVAYRQTPVSLQQFTDFGRNINVTTALNSCKFLRSELPVRLAHMVKEIDDIPPPLLKMKTVQMVRGWYLQSFKDLVEFPGLESADKNREEYVHTFTKMVAKVLTRHASVVTSIAQGILELKRLNGPYFLERPIQYFLDRLYMSRIGIRMLIGQHVELFGNKNSPATMIGVIDPQCQVTAVIRDAAENSRFLCDQYYCRSPNVEIITPHNKDQDFRFPYIPSHLYHMLFELLKNSMRAVVEYMPEDAPLSPIKVVLVKGDEDLTIKISDEGGGIPRSDMPHVFTYLYTTAQLPDTLTEDAARTDMNHAPLAGFGYGLPLSRLYARYMGGDLQLISMDGYGTDAYIYLKKSADAANEVLPTYSSNAIKHYNATSQLNDWLLRSQQNRVMKPISEQGVTGKESN